MARIKSLFGNLAVYGVGDVATSLVSLLLLPVYTRYLTPSDYGVIAMLLTIEAIAKIVFRWGVDTAFMRLYYDCRDHLARQRLASTIFFFLAAVNGTLLAITVAASGWLSVRLFGRPDEGTLITFVIVNTFVGGFYFIPFHVLRIAEQSKQFIALTFARSAGTLVTRLVLVVALDMGVRGVVVADLIVTAAFTPILALWFLPLLRPVFSRALLMEALRFGLPRVPHSIANQVIGLSDKYFLNASGTLRDVGLYSIGASFGLAPKLFLSAFESAWTPFFLGLMREPDARRIYSTVSTYVVGVVALLVAGLSTIAPDLVRLTTTPEFHAAARVTPWIALGVMCQGIYLLGSIGIVITKRTTLYPLATGIAAVVCLAVNAWLIPRHGVLGAAWANAIAYFTLAAVTVGMSLRLYPIRYESSRLLRIAAAAVAAYAVGRGVTTSAMGPLASLVVRGGICTGVYVLALFATGFFRSNERRLLRDIRNRALRGRPVRVSTGESDRTEMAGDIVAVPEPPQALEDEAPAESTESVSQRSRDGFC